MTDALAGADPLLKPEEMRHTLLEMKRAITARETIEARQTAAGQRAEDERFLAKNAGNEGVKVLPSGLQYKVLKEGAGRQPGLDDQVTATYRASLTTGLEFDSSGTSGEPARFSVHDVIPGWREGLLKMREGAHWQLFVPPNLGYGVRGPLADRAVILDVELLKVLDPAGMAAAETPAEKQE